MQPPANTAPQLRIDRDDELPVGVQLAWALRSMIAEGALAPGERMPGLREISELAGVNVNTARNVYGRLEAAGLIASRQGIGTFVVERPPGGDVSALAIKVSDQARAADVDLRELAKVLYARAQSERSTASADAVLPDVGPAADEAAARRELRRQIGRLEAQLASYPEARGDTGRHPLLRPKAHVAGVEELEAARDALIDRLKHAREKAERKGAAQSRARARRERITGNPEAHRWEAVRRDETGDPGCGELRSVPRFGPIGAMAGWWQVKVSSGCP